MPLRIDVDQVIAAKSPKWHKRLPKVVIRWLERTIHQDDMNDFLLYHSDDESLAFAKNVLKMLGAHLKVQGEENLPKTGRYIITSNHPLGGLDGLCYICLLSEFRSDIKFPVNDLLMNVKPMKDVFVPINKHGKQGHNAIQQFNDTFASDEAIIYFPAGLCSRKQKGGVIRDLEWKPTIVAKAKQYQRDIIPAYFDGKNSNFFYNLARFRKAIGIKFNIEMLYLVDEMYRQKGNTFTITFGKPITYSTFTADKNNIEWAAWLRDQTYALKSAE